MFFNNDYALVFIEFSPLGHDPSVLEWEYVPPVGPRPQKGFVGLKNAGATCYMNSVLQQVNYLSFVYITLRHNSKSWYSKQKLTNVLIFPGQLFMIDPIRSYLLAAEGAADENMEEEELEEKADNEVNIQIGLFVIHEWLMAP